MSKKNSNVLSVDGKISVKIFDGLELLTSSDMFTNVEEAKRSAQRIIKYKEKLLNSTTAYAMVFDSKKMLYYFD